MADNTIGVCDMAVVVVVVGAVGVTTWRWWSVEWSCMMIVVEWESDIVSESEMNKRQRYCRGGEGEHISNWVLLDITRRIGESSEVGTDLKSSFGEMVEGSGNWCFWSDT